MKKRSKRYQQLKEKNKGQLSLDEAISLLKENPIKFDAGVEVHLRLGIDPKKGEQVVRGSVVLPAGAPRKKKIAVFSGAEGEELIKKIKETKKIDFDIAIATPEMMRKLAPIAKILGQKGVMPNPKTETVGPDVQKMLAALESGKTTFKNDEGANVHALVARLSWDAAKIKENILALIEAVKRAKPASSKGIYLKGTYICQTMGPSIKISV